MWASCSVPFGHFSPPRTTLRECGDDQAKTVKQKRFSCAPRQQLVKSDGNKNDTFHCALGLSKDRNMHGDWGKGLPFVLYKCL